jgi:hypothetical protein
LQSQSSGRFPDRFRSASFPRRRESSHFSAAGPFSGRLQERSFRPWPGLELQIWDDQFLVLRDSTAKNNIRVESAQMKVFSATDMSPKIRVSDAFWKFCGHHRRVSHPWHATCI